MPAKMKIYNDRSGYIEANSIIFTRCLVAQWIEQKTSKLEVIGLNPRATFYIIFTLFFSFEWWCSIHQTLLAELDKPVENFKKV